MNKRAAERLAEDMANHWGMAVAVVPKGRGKRWVVAWLSPLGVYQESASTACARIALTLGGWDAVMPEYWLVGWDFEDRSIHE